MLVAGVRFMINWMALAGLAGLVSALSLVAAPAVAHESVGSAPAAAVASTCLNDPSWVAPQRPFRVFGNTWHVGPKGLGVFLITSPAGHVLIDGGIPGHASLIAENIRTLGFQLGDIKWIVNSHAHCDHAGGLTELLKLTGARLVASAADAPLLARGGQEDPQYNNRFPFPPVRVDRAVADGDQLRSGDLVMTAHATPGHTKGNTTWAWRSCEGQRCLNLVFVGSLSAPDFKLVGNPRHPTVVQDFHKGFAKVAGLPCDIALAPHPGMVDFWERVAKRDAGEPEALIDPTLCRAYAADAREDFEAKLAKQRAEAAASARSPRR
ncbi:MAG: subclass B3 metallo-beta-lactamase [Burkholderiales bacterium PBB6]|nr:MAG: subclass B3 metallo-beta-lactamase [Burkholderiales bacterium PBB6]